MILTLRSEWLKLRTVRVHFVLLALAVAFPVTVTVLVAIFGDNPETVQNHELAELISGTSVISVMLFSAVAAISLTSEFAHGTIRPTYAATPNRVRVMIAKLLVNSVVAAVLSFALIAICWVAGAAILESRDAEISLSMEDGSVGALAGLVVLAVILTWFAFGIGLIVRNSPATVSILLLWPLVAEGLVGSFVHAGEPGPSDELTPRQREVLQLLAEGRSMKEVGSVLNLTARTVAFHKYRIMEQLKVKTTAELIRYAVKHHIV